MFDNLKIGNKLILLSGSILLLLLATVIWAAFGLSTTVKNGISVAEANKLRSDLLNLEIKHDAWNEKLRTFLDDPTHHTLKIKTDPTSCALGTWLHGEERKKAEEVLPEIKGEIAAMVEPHSKMHLSAKKIEEVYQPADPALPQFLSEMEKGHVIWMSSVQNSLLAGHKQINAQKDPTQCAFGQFLGSEEAKKAAARDPEFATLLQDIIEPHKMLHSFIPRMNKALSSGNRAEAIRIYSDELLPTLAEVRYSLRTMKKHAEKKLEGLKKAKEIYQAETKPSTM